MASGRTKGFWRRARNGLLLVRPHAASVGRRRSSPELGLECGDTSFQRLVFLACEPRHVLDRIELQLEDHIREIEGLVGGYLRSPQDEATRQALLAQLDKLDDQTARADGYGNFRSVLVRYQVPRSWVIGATSDTSTAQDVPSAEFKAQVALVKAARNAIRDTTAEAQSALQRANDELAEVRRHQAGG